MNRLAVVIPNWDGEDMIAECLHSLSRQTAPHTVIVVDNGSKDRSVEIISTQFPSVVLIKRRKNLGFAEGVNIGIRYAMKNKYDYVALLNNDAVVDKHWLERLAAELDKKKHVAAAMSKIESFDKKTLDGTGEVYTSWGIHYPRGRGEKATEYTKGGEIFGASGGSTLYRLKALRDVGLFDKDFFAYYEDIDLSWRLQLRGWKSTYVPGALTYHKISVSGSRIKGFMAYQTMKNLPWVVWKNIPSSLLWQILPRFAVAYAAFYASAVARGQFVPATKGVLMSLLLLPIKLGQRSFIQLRRTSSAAYLASIIEWDLPPDQAKLRRLRKIFTGIE